MSQPRPLHEWHEDIGDVLWWLWPIEQAPWVGSPTDIGRTVSFDITIQIGVDVYEVQPQRAGDTGGWPWADADDETLARLFWTPLPDGAGIDEAIRDHIRGGPDPFKDPAPVPLDDTSRSAFDAVVQGLSIPQRDLLGRLTVEPGTRPEELRFTYPVRSRGLGLQSCSVFVRRKMAVGGADQPTQRATRGYVRLTPFGDQIRRHLTRKAN
ncbi:hypothetical protein [Sphingobium yanoikuyae]|uniref:hypothetical protein n=1 Tax=Sphingobium yanoikuyae TaxID=13690 RepID=UPI0035C86317